MTKKYNELLAFLHKFISGRLMKKHPEYRGGADAAYVLRAPADPKLGPIK